MLPPLAIQNFASSDWRADRLVLLRAPSSLISL
jgi:hypothetical protein